MCACNTMDHIQLNSNLVAPSALISLLLILAVSCYLVFVIGTKLWSGRRDGGRGVVPPSPPGLPIIGNLHQLVRGHHHRALHALSQRHGPLFLLHLGSTPTLVVSSPSLAEEVLKTQDHVFCSRPPQYMARRLLWDCRDVGFSPYGERWRQLRRIAFTHLLSAKRVESFRNLREEEVASLVGRIRRAVDEPINVTELLITLTKTVISRAAFGHKLGGMDPAKLHATINELMDMVQTVAVSDLYPQLEWVDRATGLDAKSRRMARKLDQILESVFEEHENSGQNDDEEGDLLDDLLSIQKEGSSSGFKLERPDVKGVLFDLFAAGLDTTAKSIEWAMAELIKNPQEMKKVQVELRGTLGAQGNFVKEEQMRTTSQMVQAVIKEGLRLHPPFPLLLPREVIKDTKLRGFDIPAKTRVLVNVWTISRDNESWADADKFRPDRFMQNAPDDYGDKCFRSLPFGSGRRRCPGIAFAMRLVELVLTNMLYHFDWELPDGRDLDSFQVVESSGISPRLKGGLTLVATPYHHEL